MTSDTASTAADVSPQPGGVLRGRLGARWRALGPRERRAVGFAAAALAVLVVWLVLVQPAWRTLRAAPAEIDRLDAELQRMQLLAAEVRALRAAPPVAPGQAAEALRAATTRLGGRARLSVLGDRATLSLDGVASDALGNWLAEARNAARARPLEAQLVRAAQGYNGTIVVQFGSAP